MAKKEKTDRRNFWGILYLESETYDLPVVLDAIEQYFDEWYYIVHDMDIDKDGTMKKPHVHWYGRVSSPRQFAAVSNAIGVPQNYFEAPKSEKACIRYLFHADHPNKYQYPVENIATNVPENVEKYMSSGRESTVQATMLYEFIINSRCTTMSELLGYALSQNIYAELRRGATLWRSMLQENYSWHGEN